MRIKIEDYYGNDIVELQVENIKDCHIIETDNYNVADVDEDERGEYVRVQYNIEANPDYWFVRQKNSEIDKLKLELEQLNELINKQNK